jgi:signal transduction histidine kinase
VRQRLALTVFAVTAMVTVAFLVPLAAVVRVVAADRALSAADNESRTLAGVLAAVVSPSSISAVVAQLNAGADRQVAVFLPDGSRIGAPITVPSDELALARTGRAFTGSSGGARRVWVPVRQADGQFTSGVVVVPASLLRKGVYTAWIVLALVGAFIVLLGTLMADRLARSMVVPIEDLGRVTQRLRGGDLEARVTPSGPREIQDVGQAVNQLAERIGELLVIEREAAADLSHRLRTPLTALQLEAEGVSDPADRARLTGAVQELTEAVTTVIRQARQPTAAAAEGSDLGVVVKARLAFWAVLAEDQDRSFTSQVAPGPHPVAVGPDDLAAAIDALLANIFSHTPEGTGFSVRVLGRRDSGSVLLVEDEGPGFPDASVVSRGRSGAGSTGLGLDIVRRTAERASGTLTVGRSESGGARIEVSFAKVAAEKGRARPTDRRRPLRARPG